MPVPLAVAAEALADLDVAGVTITLSLPTSPAEPGEAVRFDGQAGSSWALVRKLEGKIAGTGAAFSVPHSPEKLAIVESL